MEANKKKEEILKKHVFKLSNLGGFEIEVLEAMDEHTNQILLEKERENELLKIDLEIEKKKVLLNYESAVSFEKQAKQLQSELSEKDKALEASERLNTKHVGYIEKLEAELNEYKEKAILWDNLKTGDKLNSLVGGDSKFCEKVDKDKIKRLEAELYYFQKHGKIIEQPKQQLPKKNFHGGCVGCIVQQTYGISNCAKCRYANKFPNDLPDLGIRPSVKPDINPDPQDMGLIQ